MDRISYTNKILKQTIKDIQKGVEDLFKSNYIISEREIVKEFEIIYKDSFLLIDQKYFLFFLKNIR